MKSSVFVFLILISESTLCFQFDVERDEAVFQGKCKENLCMQLCYELHDGMFECDCTQGYELNLDGYSCKPNNISSYYPLLNESRFEDYRTSDVFYQKGVSFSAKLEDMKSENNNEINNEDNQSRNASVDYTRSLGKNTHRTIGIHQNQVPQNLSVNIPRFYQTSWLAFRPFKGANLVTEINLEFRPEQSNGILLLSGERDDLNGDFMIVLLINGLVELVFDCGSGKGIIISNEKVVLHQWNTLIIYRYRWDAWLEINDQRRIRGRSSGIFSRITFRSPVYLGGKGSNITSETLHKKKIRNSTGFSGCIRKFVVNGHQYELSKLSSKEIISTSSLNECAIDQCSFVKCLHNGRCESSSSSCLCPLGFGGNFCEKKLDLKIPFFNGTSNLRYSAIGEVAIIWLELKLEIKPQNSDGLILFSGQYDLGDFIALYLNFGFVEFIYDLGSGPSFVKSKLPISLNQWHTIKVSRTARLAVMRVDSQPESMTVSPNGFWHLSLPYSLYLGGVSKVNLLPLHLRDRGFYVGCIKQFEINDRKVELIDDALGGINVGNCNAVCTENCNAQYTSSNSGKLKYKNLPNMPHNFNDINEDLSLTNDLLKSKKYSFDVVDDQLSRESQSLNHAFREKEDNNSISYDDSAHKRIVRVSLQKTIRKNQGGACFRGNDTYVLHDLEKIIHPAEKYQNNVNIRLKTLQSNGLIIFINQKMSNNVDSFLALTIEDGNLHLRYNHGEEQFEIKYNGTRVDDGLWHRVRALRKNQKGSLRIDGGRTISIRKRTKQKLFNAVIPALYLGGASSSLLPGFIGCISDVILSSEHTEHHLDLNIFKTVTTENVNSTESL